ncbi:hypothetical protein [Streptomyces durbertensis]|nr:hypothetical protein [Streptomyces durbertensis]
MFAASVIVGLAAVGATLGVAGAASAADKSTVSSASATDNIWQ